MEKNKLGIVINTTKANNRTSGFRPIYNYNSDEWSSIVRDTGAELKKVTNNSNSDPIHLIQFVNKGCCYCIMQSIAGRKDYQSAWIFIHKDIILPKGELSSVIKKIEEILSLDVEDKKAELDSLFAKTYPTSENPSYPSSSGDTYAVRYYGDGTNLMYDDNYILEDFLYQSDYCRYKSVFLINKAKGQTVADATDLSDTKLQKNIVIDLPKEIDGFKPYSGNSIITNAIRVTEGTIIAVKWQRSGYAVIDKQGKTTEELLIKKSEYKKSFRLSLFRVIDKVTKKDLEAQIKFISLKWFDNDANPQVVFFNEEDLNKISFRVEKAGYHSFSDVIDLTKPNEKGGYVIELQPEEYIYNCYILTNIPDNHEIEFVIKTQYKLRGNEIPGFKFEGGLSETWNNKLIAASPQNPPQPPTGGNEGGGYDDRRENKGPKKRSWLKYVLCALSLVLLFSVCFALWNHYFDQTDHGDPGPLPPAPEKPQTEWERTFEYIKNNETYWIRSQMDLYPELNGVYVMIKDYQFQELKSFIEKHLDLTKLNPWNRLYEITKKYNNKKGTFRSDNDSIDIEEYLSTKFDSINDVSTQATESNKSDASSSSSVKNGSGNNEKATSTSRPIGTSTSNSSSSNSNTNLQDKLN